MLAAVATAVGMLSLRRSPIGSRGEGTLWWVDQRNAWVGFAAWSWVVPVFLVAYAALSPTPAAWEIVDAGSSLRTTKIEKVLSTKYVRSQRTGHYSSTVRVSVPFDQEAKTSEVKLSSDDKPQAGADVWVLFAPSSPELGFLVGDRQVLEEKTGGRADLWTIFLTLGGIGFCWFMNMFGRWRSDPVSGLHRSRQQGVLHVVPVSVSGVDVARDERPPSASVAGQLKPRLRMASAEFGELDLYLDEIVDPTPLAEAVDGTSGHVYWRRPTRQLPYLNSVGYAVLVLEGQRYLSGWLETADASVELPGGALVPADHELAEQGRARAIHPASAVEESANSVVLRSLLIGIVALAVVTLGVGDIATVTLAVVSVAAVLLGRRRARRLAQGHLETRARGAGHGAGTAA
ncbi:hypothetical protein [Streptomyces boluensis]|uniref:DUF3592 domain-containing protein n=1 Tax=Streptomyces boluensis TaxID=1775135 RepID=A0A964ULL8_9ACTN|nr:hypothetical protein [Streptomyces boluensis]NBE51379.1 hypothetical protein [Streptomyces boluensis]